MLIKEAHQLLVYSLGPAEARSDVCTPIGPWSRSNNSADLMANRLSHLICRKLTYVIAIDSIIVYINIDK